MARIEKSIDIDVPVHIAYGHLTRFEEFPRFMEGVREVRQLDDTHLYWHAEIAGKYKEWQASITEQLPDRCNAWRSVSGGPHAVRLTFSPLRGDRTRIHLSMDYEPEGLRENVGDALGFTTRRIEGDLERFKQFAEDRAREAGTGRGEEHGRPTDAGAGTSGTESSPQNGAALQQPERSLPSGGPHDIGIGHHGTRASSRSPNWPRGVSPGLLSGPSGVWEEPFTMIRRMSEEMDRLFETFMGRPAFSALREQPDGMARMWTPQVDISRRGDDLVVCADLPGLKKEDVHVDIDDGVLVIEGERRAETEAAGGFRTERSYGHFYRAMALPEGADVGQAKATMHDGVLEIAIPLPQRVRGHRLEIQDPGAPSASPRSASYPGGGV